MIPRPAISLIVPTRRRVPQLRRFLDSVAVTAARPEAVEVVLVVDADDQPSAAVGHAALALRRVVGAPGRTMGALNTAGYRASAGDYVMLLNDDVVARTRGWDEQILACCRAFPDGIVLVHVNDTLLRENLCTFPVVSRAFCELAGGVCPPEYERYRIDDHVEDVFNLLGVLGERRAVYLPDVVFEHLNAVQHPEAGRVYLSDPAVLARDAPRFDALLPARKELALRLLDHIKGGAAADVLQAARRKLQGVTDPFALRVPGRQRVVRAPWWRRPRDLRAWAAALLRRARARVRRAVGQRAAG